MTPLTLLIADDHRLFRDGLRHLLDKQPGLKVIAETTDGAATVAAVAKLKPDILLLDISMPELNGIEAARRITAQGGATRIIMLSMHADRRFITESLKAGAAGYLLKDSAFAELLRAVQAVRGGTLYLSSRLSASLIREYVAGVTSSPGSAFAVLSAREREVLQLLAEGKSTKAMAATLHVSVKTVESHRKQVMDKLDIHSVAELTKYAIREGLTPLD